MARGGHGNEAPEGQAFIASTTKKQTKMQSFCEFLYDKKAGKVLGRTGKSWFWITVFYIIFYSCLFGFFGICLAVFIKTLNEDEPTYYGKSSILGTNPAMGYQPWLKSDPESTLIHINVSKSDSVNEYVAQMQDWFSKRYDDTEKDNKKRDKSNIVSCEGETEQPKDKSKVCAFDPWGLFPLECLPSSNFSSFKDGQPCVVLTLNRLFQWRPLDFLDGSIPDVPESIKKRYQKGHVAINCDGQNPHDQDIIGDVEYYPPAGFDAKYFPYRKVPNYQQPIAMVKFKNLPRGQLVMVECRAYALNIKHDREEKLGMVQFELLVDGNKGDYPRA